MNNMNPTFRMLILSALEYKMVDENTGAVNEGVSFNYFNATDLTPCVDEKSGKKGIDPFKQSVSVELGKKIIKAPAVYDVEYGVKAVQGKPMMVPVGITYVGSASLSVDEEKKDKK